MAHASFRGAVGRGAGSVLALLVALTLGCAASRGLSASEGATGAAETRAADERSGGAALLAHLSGDRVVSGLYRIEVSTGERGARLVEGETRFAIWSPSRRKILYGRGFGNGLELWTMRADGSRKRRLTDNDVMDAAPSWSPDSQEVVFERRDVYAEENARLFIISASGRHERPLLGDGALHFGADWSPNDVIAFNAAEGIELIQSDGTGRRKLAAGAGPLWSPDGTRLLVQRRVCEVCDGSDDSYALYSVAHDGADEIELTRSERTIASYTWSPDGSHVAFSTHALTTDLWVVKGDGTDAARLFDGLAHHDAQPTWSASGRWVAFTRSKRRGSPDIWRARSDGSRVVAVTSTRGVSELQPTWHTSPHRPMN